MLATFLSPFSLSNTALLWATVIGAIGSLVFVITPSTASGWLIWLLTVAVSQALFAVVILGMRRGGHLLSPLYVALTLAIAGALRGITIAMGVQVHSGHGFQLTELFTRTGNSIVISVIGVALIGGTLAWLADYRGEYQLLVDRAVALEAMRRGDDTIDFEVLETWASVKLALDDVLERARQELTSPATSELLESVSLMIATTVNTELRPVSQMMWSSPVPAAQRLRFRSFLADTLRNWRPPTTAIIAFYAVVIGIGAVVRIGLTNGLGFIARYLVVVGLMLWFSKLLAARLHRHAQLIAVSTLFLLPVVLLMSDWLIVRDQLQIPIDVIGDAIIALQTPITVLFIAVAVSTFHERPRIIGELQQRIDEEVVSLVARQGHVRRLGQYIHHSVQSELSAIAMQLHEAAMTEDASTRSSVRQTVLERLDRFQAIDATAPPWLGQSGGRDRIREVISAWAGIMSITVDLPNEDACRLDQWHVAASVIEEALANAARHGDASEVSIRGAVVQEAFRLVIADNGTQQEHGESARTGIGTQWLDRVAPGEWTLSRTHDGATLTVLIS